jgi:dolichol-phosphate mannosyltransferase
VVAVAAASLRAMPPVSGENSKLAAARGWLFIRSALFIPLAVFAVFSLRHEVKLDWTGAPWTAALPLMAIGMSASTSKLARLAARVRNAWTPTLVTLMLIYGAGLHYLVLGLPGIGYGTHIELVPVGWRELSRQITRVAAAIGRETGEEPLIVGMDRYAVASELAFYGAAAKAPSQEISSQYLFGGLGLMYERWMPAQSADGRTLLMVALDPRDLSGMNVASHVERLGPVEEAALTEGGLLVRHYYYRVGYGYSHAARGYSHAARTE